MRVRRRILGGVAALGLLSAGALAQAGAHAPRPVSAGPMAGVGVDASGPSAGPSAGAGVDVPAPVSAGPSAGAGVDASGPSAGPSAGAGAPRPVSAGPSAGVGADVSGPSAGPSVSADVGTHGPLPAATGSATASSGRPICWFGGCFDYVSGSQYADMSGASVRMLQAAPRTKAGYAGSHSVQELTLQSTDQKSTLEIGWIVMNGGSGPHLFVYHWVNGSPQGTSGFVQVSSTVKDGTSVQAGTAAGFRIQNVAGDWWMYYNDQAVGYFPGSLWGGGFTHAGMAQVFGEVEHAKGVTCEEMGNGLPGTSPGSSWIDSFALLGTAVAPHLSVSSTSRALYDAGSATPTSFHLGGAGTGPC